MRFLKSINSSHNNLIISILTIVILLLVLFNINSLLRVFLFILVIYFSSIAILLKKIHIKNNFRIKYALIFSLVLEFLLLFVLRQVRKVFEFPLINNEKIIGYAQYNGYSLSFDSLYLILMILLPIIILFIFLNVKTNKK